jgi:hypothetical protein
MNTPTSGFISWLIFIISVVVLFTIIVIVGTQSTYRYNIDKITTDCEKLGGFYVNQKTYKCELVK